MSDPEREENVNENPMNDPRDFSICYSPDFSVICFSQTSSPQRIHSPEFEVSLWTFPDGNFIPSTQPHVRSPSPPSPERSPRPASQELFNVVSSINVISSTLVSSIVVFDQSSIQRLEEFVLVQELDRLQNENRELHKFIQHASQITLQTKINMAHEICEEGHDNSSIEILDKMTLVADNYKFHLSWTKAPCWHRSLANGGDLKKSCTSFDGCHMHQDCMSTAKLEIYVERHIERFQGALSSHIEDRFVHYARKIELQSFHCESIASADDQPDSRCELTHISYSTKSPPGLNGLLDGEEMLQQDSLKHQLVGESYAMNDGENIPSDGGIQSAFSYPENEGDSKKCRKIRRKITLEDLQHFPGTRKDAAKSFAVSESTIKRRCRENGIEDWRYRGIDENIQSLSKPKDIIESIQGEGAKMGNQMAGGSRSCERELNHEQTGFLLESEKDSDRSQIRIGLMEESSTQMEITPAADMFVFSQHEQCIEEGDPLELLAQPSELNFSDACLRPDASNFTQIDHNISATVASDIEQVPESSQTNLTGSDPAPKLAEATAPHMTALVTEMKDTTTVTMKATYGEDMIRFQLSLTSGIMELRKEVAERLTLKVGTFSIKYLDDDEDWILMTGDKDLQECFKVSLGRKVIKLWIHEITPS